MVIRNTALFVIFAISFSTPRTGRDWRAMGGFTAFLVALFTEMYGVPLTVYLLSGWRLARSEERDVASVKIECRLPGRRIGSAGRPTDVARLSSQELRRQNCRPYGNGSVPTS